MRRVVLSLAVLCAACSTTAPPDPTPAKPIIACKVSCPRDEYLSRRQHLCRVHEKRYFTPLLLIGRYTTRNADGTVNVDRYIARYGENQIQDVDVIDVALGTCNAVIAGIVQSRQMSERGIEPGEEGIPPDQRH
jgi:hypothetical protein